MSCLNLYWSGGSVKAARAGQWGIRINDRWRTLRLARYFGTDAQSWLNLQAAYDLRLAENEGGKTIERQVKPRAA